MSKLIEATRWILASMTMGVLAMGCAVGTGQESESESVSGEEGPALSEQAGGLEKTTIYYASDSKGSEVVGMCTFRSCAPKGLSCWGTKTPYYQTFTTPCF